MAEHDPRSGGPSSQLAEVARHAGHGLTLAAAVFLFFLAGWWLDGQIGTRPLFAIIGAMLGALTGFYSLYQNLVLKPEARRSAEDAGDRSGGGSGDGATDSDAEDGR